MLIQRSLFPDAFEIEEQALAKLDRFELEDALRLVADARARDPGLDLEWLRVALLWLRRELGGERVSDELLALLFLTVPEACLRGELTAEAAARLDEVIARQGLARAEARAFLDPEGRVHRGALLLVLRRNAEAHALLREAVAADDGRADLWGGFAEASYTLERLDEANAAYVRALLLAAGEVDLLRLRHPRLLALQRELAALHGEACARELLLVHAWLAGVLTIPPENGWLDAHLSRLHLLAAVRATSPPEQRLRRFTLLFYRDRSQATGRYDEAEREEMQALDPELFERVLKHIQAREQVQTRALCW